VLDADGTPSAVNAFESNQVVGSIYNKSEQKTYAYVYNIDQPQSDSNPSVILGYNSSAANGISGNYVIGTWRSPNSTPETAPAPTGAPTPVVNSVGAGGGGGGSVYKNKYKKKLSAKKSAAKKKPAKKKPATKR